MEDVHARGNLRRNFRGQLLGWNKRQRPYRGIAGDDRLPEVADILTRGRDNAKSGYDDPRHGAA